MLLFCHLLVGAAIATKIANPILALPLAFLSHYFFDLFPHYEYSVKNIKERRWSKSFFDFFKVFLDIGFGLFIILLLSENTLLIFTAAFLAVLPDGSTVLFKIFHKNELLNKHLKFHQKLHAFGEIKKIPTWGKFLSQLIIAVLAIFFLL